MTRASKFEQSNGLRISFTRWISIHPRTKSDVGYRLSRAGLAVAYKQSVEYLGPLVSSVVVASGSATIDVTYSSVSSIELRNGNGFEVASTVHWLFPEIIMFVCSDLLPRSKLWKRQRVDGCTGYTEIRTSNHARRTRCLCVTDNLRYSIPLARNSVPIQASRGVQWHRWQSAFTTLHKNLLNPIIPSWIFLIHVQTLLTVPEINIHTFPCKCVWVQKLLGTVSLFIFLNIPTNDIGG